MVDNKGRASLIKMLISLMMINNIILVEHSTYCHLGSFPICYLPWVVYGRHIQSRIYLLSVYCLGPYHGTKVNMTQTGR